jgi:enoyl-[acyl-carrier protein] reductase I
MSDKNLNNGIMSGKRGIVMGVANDRSIAWGIAVAAAKAGAEIAFTYQGEALEKRVRPLAESIDSNIVLPCDVSSDEAIDKTFEALKQKWETIDFVVHAIAYSDKEELKGDILIHQERIFILRWIFQYIPLLQ